jgi:triosephosphate isomerase
MALAVKPGKFFLGTNWKMHFGNREAQQYVSEILPLLAKTDTRGLELFIIPSFISLGLVRQAISDSEVDLKLGAQNVHWETGDESTGEISVRMLKEIPVDLVEVGHSERRQKFCETDATVRSKVRSILDQQLRALICVGEVKSEKETGTGAAVLARQMRAALENVTADEARLVSLAYEPAWAIGVSGQPADPSYVGEQHDSLRGVLVERFGEEVGVQVAILYGGSVNHENFSSYATLRNVDGLFVGRSAWTPSSFVRMVNGIRELGLGPGGRQG